MLIRRLAWATNLSFLLWVSPAVAQTAPPEDRAAEITKLETSLREEQARQGIPGLVVVVIENGSVAWTASWGVANVETKIPVGPETMFQIGSLTKTFTATAIASAATTGKLDLSRSAGSYVAGLTPCVASMTIEELLSHRSGLSDEPDEYGPHDESNLLTYARTWGPERCFLPRGTTYSYSNSGFALAGLALQEALGKPYADLMGDLVFTPLGMTRTTFRPTMAMTYPLALGHRPNAEGKPTVVRPVGDDARLWPAGEIWTNANELARFVIALLEGGKLEGAQKVPAEAIRQITQARAEVPTVHERYGLGLALREYRGLAVAGHGGTMPGFSVLLDLIPERRLGVFVLTNLETTDARPLIARTFDAFLPAEDRAREPRAAEPARAELPSNPERYLGSFSNPGRWVLEIEKKDQQLVLKQFGREFPLERVDDRRFRFNFSPGNSADLIFGPLDEGGPKWVQFYVWTFARKESGATK